MLTLTLSAPAHGGNAVGHDENGRAIFVPFALPGETVRVRLVEESGRFAHAELLEVLEPSAERVEPRCRHFGVCGGCHWQHAGYSAQLQFKREIVADQLLRLGHVRETDVRPVWSLSGAWGTQWETIFSAAPGGHPGYWSPYKRQVIAISECPILHQSLESLIEDFTLDLPGLRKLTLRLGDDESILAALEVDDAEPPELEVDFPISVALVLPDHSAATLIGDAASELTIQERTFTISPGAVFPPSPEAAALIVTATLELAALKGTETILELPAGSGLLTAFLAGAAAHVAAVEPNSDAVADLATNLDDLDNISLYEGTEQEVLPNLDIRPDLLVFHPAADGLSSWLWEALEKRLPPRFIYISTSLATFARDTRRLAQLGYRLAAVQPIDTTPHHYRIDTVSLFERLPAPSPSPIMN
jgi:23S rRNA (uracil1939-C5)-methyltransferase